MRDNYLGKLKINAKIAKFLLFALLPFILYLISLPISSAMLFYPKNAFFPKIVIGLKIRELGSDELSTISKEDLTNQWDNKTNHVDVPQWQQNYYSKFNIPPVVVSLDYIYIPKALRFSDKELCINQLIIRHLIPNQNNPTESKLLKTTVPICLNVGMNYFISNESEQKTFIYDRHIDPFWYPFDLRTLNFEILTDGTAKHKKLEEISHTVDIISVPPRWITWIIFTRSTENLNVQNHKVNVVLTRPLLYPILSILVPFTVFMLLVRVLPNVAREKGSFWEITVGLILGLWGFSEVLIPEYINFPTLIGYVILFLYIPLVFFIRNISLSYKHEIRVHPNRRKNKTNRNF